MQEYNWTYRYETDVESDTNQYTYEECHRIGPVDAKYVKSTNPDFNGNPFIEALPRPRDKKPLMDAYTMSIPKVDFNKLNKMTPNEQKETVLSLKQLRLPLAFQKQLEFINYDVIVSSYLLRKMYKWKKKDSPLIPLGHESTDIFVKMKGKIEDSAPSGFSLLGFSGCGKSSSLKPLFENIPQVIMHHPDPGTNIPQITYLVVSCMPNSNFQTLYRQIGEAIDNALGKAEPTYEVMITKKCRSLADKQLKVCQLIELFSIGTIVLDEIQLIDFRTNKENSYEGILGIVNKTKIALSVVGTDDAYKKLFSKLRNARRSGDFIDASEYTTDRTYFDYLTKMLFNWQWVQPKIKWTKEIGDALYKCSGGIINQLIWIYKWMMLEYIDSKAKGEPFKINANYVEYINNRHFKHLKDSMDLVEQVKIEELEDERIIMSAMSDRKKYEMPAVELDEFQYETEVITKVINFIRPLYPEYNSDRIGRVTKEVLNSEESHKLEANEIAQKVLAELQGKKKCSNRSKKRNKPTSKNICDYITT